MCPSAVRPDDSPIEALPDEQQELILSPNRRLDRMCHRQVSPFRISAAGARSRGTQPRCSPLRACQNEPEPPW